MQFNIKLKIIILVIALTSFTACKDGFNYKTSVIYKAEASNLTVHLEASGFILHGHDLDDDGRVEGYMVSPKLEDTIYIQANENELFLSSNKNNKLKKYSSDFKSVSIKHYLNAINYKDYNAEELIELENVIKATAYGAKGTYINGQTNLIKVLKVDFNTY